MAAEWLPVCPRRGCTEQVGTAGILDLSSEGSDPRAVLQAPVMWSPEVGNL